MVFGALVAQDEAAASGWHPALNRSRRVSRNAPLAQKGECAKLYAGALAIEAEMRSLVESVVGKKPPEGFDPLDLLSHPKVGADLGQLGREWFKLRAAYWAAEGT